MDVQKMLAPYRPSVPLPELVRALNFFYHEIETERYDWTHGGIIPVRWAQIPGFSAPLLMGLRWAPASRVLAPA